MLTLNILLLYNYIVWRENVMENITGEIKSIERPYAIAFKILKEKTSF